MKLEHPEVKARHLESDTVYPHLNFDLCPCVDLMQRADGSRDTIVLRNSQV